MTNEITSYQINVFDALGLFVGVGLTISYVTLQPDGLHGLAGTALGIVIALSSAYYIVTDSTGEADR